MIRCRQKALFGGDSAEDEVWMFGIGGQELTRCFNGCMSRLHGHLRRRQIAAHQQVEMWNLAEWLVHTCLPLTIISFTAGEYNTPGAFPFCESRRARGASQGRTRTRLNMPLAPGLRPRR